MECIVSYVAGIECSVGVRSPDYHYVKKLWVLNQHHYTVQAIDVHIRFAIEKLLHAFYGGIIEHGSCCWIVQIHSTTSSIALRVFGRVAPRSSPA